jgi:hypothetical protein
VLFAVGRFDKPDGRKVVLPATRNGSGWHWRGPSAPRPLYGLNRLAAQPDATVLMVEGEKAADEARGLFPDHACITWQGGSEAVADADLTPLAGRNVVLWPDNDEAGRVAITKLADRLRSVARSVRVVSVPESWPVKWDVADPRPHGVTVEALRTMVRDATPVGAADWPELDLSLLDDRRGDLPPFPLGVLPPFWQSWCERAAQGAGAPVDYVALSLLSASAALIGGARCIAPAPSWCEPCVLWTALIGAPSSGKTPAIEAVLRMVRELEGGLSAKNSARHRQQQAAVEAAHARRERWRCDVQTATKQGAPPPDMPSDAEEPPAFVPRQLAIADATIEAVADVLQGNPRGLLQYRDELSGWLANMGRYANGGSDRPFWLSAWSANPYVVNRKGKTPVNVARPAVSILGTIQPDVMAAALAGDDDGMGARFLYAWPERPAYRPLSDTVESISLDALNALVCIRDMPDGSRDVPLSREARALFEDFRRKHHAEAVSLDGLEAGWWGKGQGTVLRLAGVWTFLDWASRQGTPEPQSVDVQAIVAAAGLWHGYLWPHARAVFGTVGNSDRQRHARRTLRWIKARGLSEVSREQLRCEALGRACNAAEVEQIADSLMAGGWLRPNDAVRSGPGRPPRRWVVNPRVGEISHA